MAGLLNKEAIKVFDEDNKPENKADKKEDNIAWQNEKEFNKKKFDKKSEEAKSQKDELIS